MKERGTTRTTFIGIIALSFTAILASARPAAAGDPDIVYETIRTEHFNIHYQEELEHTARRIASIAEEVFEDLTILFRWQVKKRIEVVITDSTDSANGSASVYGRPVIRLYATAPTFESSLQSHDFWLRTLFVHEFTHIVHLSIHGKTSDVINSIFGDVYNPNQMLPRFIIEGIAVLIETHETQAGRIRSSLYNMYVRTAALEETLLNLGQVSNTTRTYLRGAHSYIYGAMFMEYVYQKFGMEKIIAFCHDYGSSVLPYGINRAFLDNFGQDIKSLYREWVEETVRRAEETKTALEKEGITESIALTADGESKGGPIFDIDGRSILIPVSNGMEDASVFRIPIDGSSDPEQVFLSSSSADLSIDRNGRIYYNRGAPFKNFYWFQDVFTVDRYGQRPKRLTFGVRAQYVAASPRGDRLAVVVNDAGTMHLKLADENGNFLSTLIQSANDDQVYYPTWSPDGKKVAAAVREGSFVDIVVVDVTTGTRTFITKDPYLDGAPEFDPTGRYLLFSSDRTGISNIYAYDFKRGVTLKVTNVLSGVYNPAVSHDGKILAFLKYRSEGYDLHVMPLDLSRARVAPPIDDTFVLPPDLPSPADDLPSARYNPIPVMVPSYWMLNAQFDVDWNSTLQAVVGFADVTRRSHAGLDITYNTESRDVSGRVAFSYSGLGPGINVGVSRQYVPQTEGYIYEGKNKDWTQVVTRASLGLGFPIYGVDTSHSLSVNYSVIHSRPVDKSKLTLDPEGELPEVPESYFRASLSLGWSYSDTVSSPLGIGPHKGRSISANLDLSHPTIGGTRTLTTFNYRWTEYFEMPWLDYHTFTVSLNGGIHISDPPNQWSFVMGGYTPQNIVDTILNNTSAGGANLRGYPPGAFRGSHFHALRLNYRFPIWFAELGYGTVPVFLRRVQAAVFNDNAVISYDELDRDDWKTSVGGEIVIHFTLGYYQDMSARFSYARGFMEGGINEFVFLVSGSL